MSKSSARPTIRLRGVRHNNLKNFDLDLPLNQLIVVAGLSGSGKSSLAFDTLFAEGQRRYVETFSPYARQFFDRMDKPRVDSIEGIPPAIAIEQRNAVRTTRSTVGTLTEICDHLKMLWPHVAQLHCRKCGRPVRKESPQQIWETVANSKLQTPNSEIVVTFDVPLAEKLSLEESLALIARQGYQRLLVAGRIVRLDETTSRITHHASRIEHLTVVQDRLKRAPAQRARFVEACEQAYHFGKGKLAIHEIDSRRREPRTRTKDGNEDEQDASSKLETRNPKHFSNRLHCAECDIEYGEPTPALFSFNHPVGACPACKGFGRIITIDYDLAIPDPALTLAEGAVRPWRSGFSAECQQDLAKFCKIRGVPMTVPFAGLSAVHRRWVLEGDPDYGRDEEHEWPRAWYGVKGYFRWLESKAYKMHVRVLLSRYRAYTACPACQGARFQPETLLYRLTNDDLRFARDEDGRRVESEDASIVNRQSQMTLADFYALPIRDALALIESLEQTRNPKPETRNRRPETRNPELETRIARDPVSLALSEVRSRLAYLNEVGLGYLTLDRPTRSLSGGETERVNLTTCLGTRLVNTLFVLDEPSVGLHPRDTERLVRILQQLRDAGNTVVVVEHEAGVMRAADQIVELGPGQGATGGQVVFQGTYSEILESGFSLTGQYLSGMKRIEIPERRLAGNPKPETRNPKQIRSSKSEKAAASPPLRASDLCWLTLDGAAKHNLKNLTVSLPLGRFVCVTGVSGSGKTTLVREVLLPALERNLKSRISDLKSRTVKASERFEDLPALPRHDGSAAGEDETLETRNAKPATRNSQPGTILSGHENIGRVVLVDQSILGKTPRSNPAVYIGAFDDIREFFAQSEPARQRGLSASAFSFNSAQGQCERCRGAGFEKIEMQFLSDVFIRCPDCGGRRFRQHVLQVKVRSSRRKEAHPELRNPKSEIRNDRSLATSAATEWSWSIADVLDATVDEVIEFLAAFPDSRPAGRAVETLELLQEVGLGYLRLGQPINTLSGGESQRLKLVAHLAEATAANPKSEIRNPSSERQPTGASGFGLRASNFRPTLFLFDEPTTGLHFDDVRVLLKVFQRLVSSGHSVVVVEHNLDVIKCADWVIDLGPEAGDGGGQVVAQGTPEQVAECRASHTGRFLRDALGRESRAESRETQARFSVPPSTLDAESSTDISIHGAREHNLKNLSLAIPRNRFVVITGVSGSGKSTLALDLLFAEGQRRFLDSMSVYARQFVEQLSRPDVDLITGIPPTVSIEQRNSRGGGKSTVATVTEVYHFIRLLFARLGTQFCPACQVPVEAQTRDELGRRLRRELKGRGDLVMLAPVVRSRKGFHTDVAEWAAKHGYAEVRADGKRHATHEPFRLDRFREHNVEIVTGVLKAKRSPAEGGRAAQPLIDETLKLGNGTVFALDHRGQVTVHSTERSCPNCGRSFEPLDPKNFSHNSPQGWCPRCRGFGELFYMPEGVDRGAREDAIAESWYEWMEGQRELCPDCGGSRLNPIARAVRLAGNFKFQISDFKTAPTIDALAQMSVAAADTLFRQIKFKGAAVEIARDILPEIRERLRFLGEVGLGYLQLGRGVPTLSSGEAQRIRLAAQLGSNLSGVLYILDEPTIGLHARDNERLLATLQKLKARGNSVIVVEHDEETMRRADHVIDLGPGAGVHGGQVVAAGTLKELRRHPESVTGRWLRARKSFPSRGHRRTVAADVRKLGSKPEVSQSLLTSAATKWLELHGAARHNLKNLTVRFPLGRLVCITGVSGSGKSTLIRECLLPALQAQLKTRNAQPETRNPKPETRNLAGFESLKAVYEVDQSPIGRTPRSIPATYVGFFDDIRRLFAQLPEARLRGYSPGRFSFNSPQGRCPECLGAGQIKLEMNFLPPAFVRCEVCGGTRFNPETLDVEYHGRNIAQVLELSVEEAMDVFASIPKIKRALQALCDTGLDYLKLGQTSPTLSGGEAQRVKLVTRLLAGLTEGRGERVEGGTEKGEARGGEPRSHFALRTSNLFILEEPTIGLHMADVRRLVDVLQRLVDAGHSVIVIEHNLDLIAEADWIIDLGPEGGDAGGRIVAEGTPEGMARNKRSHTGRFLRSVLTRT